MPYWLAEGGYSNRTRNTLHRLYNILRILAVEGPLNKYRLSKHGNLNLPYQSLLRYIKLLEGGNFVSITREGRRRAQIYEVTDFGVFFCWFQHYLSSEELVQYIIRRSKIISILSVLPDFESKIKSLTYKLAPYLFYSLTHYSLNPANSVGSAPTREVDKSTLDEKIGDIANRDR